MATQIACDRCKSVTPNNNTMRFSILPTWYLVAPNPMAQYREPETIDLCEACYGDFRRFLNTVHKEKP